MWEDLQCQDGGKWAVRVPKTHTNKYWEDLVLALIGDQFTHENEVNGIVVQLKPKEDQFQIWNRSGKDSARIEALKTDIEDVLKLDESMKLDYENFADALSKYAQQALEKKDDSARFAKAGYKKQEGADILIGRGRGQI